MDVLKGCLLFVAVYAAFFIPAMLASESGESGFFGGIGVFTVTGFILWALFKIFIDKK
ncbi:MAG: hypothetical protein RBT80_24710 [Candidatus Vecturithrix sp.]|nr:hypothetical protein [Candidatus Vecturithrix sp.]